MEKLESRFLTQVTADTQYNDADMGTEAQKFYQEYFPESIYSERGETWFTPIALIELIHKKEIQSKLVDKVKGTLIKEYKLDLMSNISQKIVGRKISEDYHSLVNFGCIPRELNWWRGGEDYENIKILLPPRLNLYNRSRLGDFPDLFLLCVKSYLTGTEEDGYDSQIEGKKLNDYNWWFEKIGEGKMCTWEDFVNKMHLKGNFVNDNYEVVKLFDHSIGNPFPNLEYLKNQKTEYTIEDFTQILCNDIQIKTCIENIYDIWYKRAKHFESLDILSIERK